MIDYIPLGLGRGLARTIGYGQVKSAVAFVVGIEKLGLVSELCLPLGAFWAKVKSEIAALNLATPRV